MSHTTALCISAIAIGACAPKHTYPDGSGLEGQLEREIIALRSQIHRMETESGCGGGPDPIYGELHQVLVDDDVSVANQGNVTVVTLAESHLFGADELSIRQEARMTLDMLATALTLHADYTVLVEGHTSDASISPRLTTYYPDLWTLGYGRATAVMRVLVDEFHIAEARFTLATRGPNAPVASNDTSAGQSRNRRVVLYIYPPSTSPN